MNRIKRILGVAQIATAVVLLVAIVVAIIFYKDGFSPVNAFYNELGMFSGGYFVLSYSLLFNLSFILFGFVFGALMVIDGLQKDTTPSAVIAFFGALTGVLAMAQGIFTLNLSSYHYIVSAAFCISALVLCALYVIFNLLAHGRKQIVTMIVAVLAGACSAVYAWYMLSGDMARFFIADASIKSREGLLPFALTGWAALALFMVFTVIYSLHTLKSTNDRLLEDVEKYGI